MYKKLKYIDMYKEMLILDKTAVFIKKENEFLKTSEFCFTLSIYHNQ